MSRVTCHISVSLDGFVAGPNQGLENPLGEGGTRLHEWAFADPRGDVDSEVIEEVTRSVGAYIMGRKMFGGGEGPWKESWTGWWGEDPPFHAPVFVLTHHPRELLTMKGGTTFRFVTEGVDAALRHAREAAGGRDVAIAGGAKTVQQYLRRGHLDELYLHVVPVLLGAGERLLEGVGDPVLEPVTVVASPMATHIRYRVAR